VGEYDVVAEAFKIKGIRGFAGFADSLIDTFATPQRIATKLSLRRVLAMCAEDRTLDVERLLATVSSGTWQDILGLEEDEATAAALTVEQRQALIGAVVDASAVCVAQEIQRLQEMIGE
jgi:hypothetical protein